MNKILVILGPTATGKTDLALYFAKKFNGELISCDSRQVYVGLDVGTGKMPTSGKWEVRQGIKKWEVGGVNIWMYDVVSPKRQYTVFNYVKDVQQALDGILKRGKLPIIVGGTGLYLKALIYGLSNLAIPVDQKLRKQLDRLSLEELQEKLKNLSSKKWAKINNSDRQNPRRLIRAIELAVSSPEVNPSLITRDDKSRLEIVRDLSSVLKIGLTAPRHVLYQKADERVVSRIKQGMIEEAKRLYKNELSYKRMRQLGLEYGVLADYLEGKIKTRKDLIKIMQYKIHGYVRRQLTWFKKEKNIFWFDITKEGYIKRLENLVARWYHQANDSKNRHFS